MSNNYMMDSQMQSLDRELELLKRKREMIQHQWEIIEQEKNLTLMMDSSRNQNNRPRIQNNSPRYQNNSPRFQNNSPRFQNNAPRKQFHSPRNQFNPPRNQNNTPRSQQISPWSQDDFSVPVQHEQSFNTFNKFKSRGKKRRVEHTDWQSDNQSSDRFIQNKKPKANVIVETKPKQSKNTHCDDDDDFVLREGQEASVQVQGRLELGLGTILKDLRLSKLPHAREIFSKSEYLKELKTELRKRIHSCMLGKKVSNLQVVVENYRLAYPKRTNKDLLAFIMFQTVIPDTFETYRKYVDEKLSIRIDTLFDKLKEILDEEEAAKTKTQKGEATKEDDKQTESQEGEAAGNKQQADENQTAAGDSEKLQEIEKAAGTSSAAEGEVKEIEDKEKQLEQFVENPEEDSEEKKESKPVNDTTEVINLTKWQIEALDRIVNRHLNSMLPKHKRTIIRFIHQDTDFMDSIGITRFREEVKEIPGLLFVRVVGKPNLPKKEEMQSFLNKFNPVVMKKHKYVHNLLFVGVKELSEFEALIAAHGTVIGGNELNVKATTKTQDGLNIKKTNEQETHEESNDNKTTENGQKKEVDTDASNKTQEGHKTNEQETPEESNDNKNYEDGQSEEINGAEQNYQAEEEAIQKEQVQEEPLQENTNDNDNNEADIEENKEAELLSDVVETAE